MPSRLTPFGWLAKYLVVPILVAAIGFLFVGPRVGKDFLRGSAPLLRKKIEAVVTLAPKRPDPSNSPPTSAEVPAGGGETTEAPKPDKPDADVSVSVRPAPAIKITSPPPFRRHRRRKPTTVPAGPPTGQTPTERPKSEATPTPDKSGETPAVVPSGGEAGQTDPG